MNSQKQSRRILVMIAIGLTLVVGMSLAAGEEVQEETDPSGYQPPAWYDDPELGVTWKRFTGRYIFERACTSCHQWGPNYWTSTKWKTYMNEFPENHEPPISKEYSDLTAMFRPATYVPNSNQRADTLKEFLLSEATDDGVDEAERLVPYASLPQVGDPAPDFEIVDVGGHRHRVSEYQGKQQLVLIFSRANW